MAGPKPAWLTTLVKQLRHEEPYAMPSGALNKIAAQRKEAQRLSAVASELGDSQGASANHMIRSALKSAESAPGWLDSSSRLVHMAAPDEASSRMALLYRTPGYMSDGDNALLREGVYIESLGSLDPGLGRAALEAVAERYPDSPMILESLPLPETLEFYAKRGFKQLDKNPTGGKLPFLYLDRGADLKARGGLVRSGSREKRQEAGPQPFRLSDLIRR